MKYFRLIKIFCPLIAARASSFVLTQKNQKVKTEKTFCPQGQLPARFSVGRLRAIIFLLSLRGTKQSRTVHSRFSTCDYFVPRNNKVFITSIWILFLTFDSPRLRCACRPHLSLRWKKSMRNLIFLLNSLREIIAQLLCWFCWVAFPAALPGLWGEFDGQWAGYLH